MAEAQATDDRLKCFVRVSVKVSVLEGLGCWLSKTMKEISCPLVAVAVEMSVAQMLKLYLSSKKVSVAVVAGTDGSFHLPCPECHLEVLQF